jgi:hypothetical protein
MFCDVPLRPARLLQRPEARIGALSLDNLRLRSEIESLRNSASWRATAPVRAMPQVVRKLCGEAVAEHAIIGPKNKALGRIGVRQVVAAVPLIVTLPVIGRNQRVSWYADPAGRRLKGALSALRRVSLCHVIQPESHRWALHCKVEQAPRRFRYASLLRQIPLYCADIHTNEGRKTAGSQPECVADGANVACHGCSRRSSCAPN